MKRRIVVFLLALLLLFSVCAHGEEVGFATPEDALRAWLLALKKQDFANAASCFAAESVADHITEEIWTCGKSLPNLSDGGNQMCLLIPHKAYRDMNIANLKAHASSVTMVAACALAVPPEEEAFAPQSLYHLLSRMYQEEIVTEKLELLHTTNLEQLESLMILGNVNAEEYLLESGVQPAELAAEVSTIISAYGAQDARVVAVEFAIATHGRCMVIMYALQYHDHWYLLGPSRLLIGTSMGVAGGTGVIMPD